MNESRFAWAVWVRAGTINGFRNDPDVRLLPGRQGPKLSVGRFPDGRYALITDLRPGGAPDGSCAYREVAASPTFEGLMAAIRLFRVGT